ncbi:hypothetical protein [Priestia sp. D3YE.R1]|uniref:hypothetical protein n=1 Tax=Priestia sp. D3YE.R1 TaxID=3400416 RepID=UPI003BA34EA4
MSLKTRLQKIEEAISKKQSNSYCKDKIDYKIKEFEEKMICIYEQSDGSKKNILNLIKKKAPENYWWIEEYYDVFVKLNKINLDIERTKKSENKN